ncbi:thermonuclease family protein [Brachyspira innocens]|uniref:thermonuclease family protein n=1 Tax=Brachyspira innocens TaxID=13264 RepID=UPI0026EEBDD5|nr:thermonuclease family protein [Brachyspira innocens]
MRNIIILLFLFCFCLYSKTYDDTITDFEIVKVRDGDTFVINIPNIPQVFGSEIAVRIRGIDTPELRDNREEVKKRAYEAKTELEKLLLNAKEIILYNIGRDKYFRILASVKADEIDIGEYMIKNKFAVKYR